MSLRRETYRDYLATPLSPSATAHIEGNASRELKEVPLKWYNIFRTLGKGGFGYEAGKRIVVKELSIQPTVNDPSKMEARLVCEIEVTADMCDGMGMLHQGCMAFLMDEGSAIALLVMNIHEGGENSIGVSQTLNILYHAAAPLGTRLRIINRSVTAGGEMDCCRSEIWDLDKHRLIVSVTQIQMAPSGLFPSFEGA